MFTVTHLYGSEDPEDFSTFEALLDELDQADEEHFQVSVTHESEWSLGVFEKGFVVWENLTLGSPRHMLDLSRSDVLELMAMVAEGRLEQVEAMRWRSGYGN